MIDAVEFLDALENEQDFIISELGVPMLDAESMYRLTGRLYQINVIKRLLKDRMDEHADKF